MPNTDLKAINIFILYVPLQKVLSGILGGRSWQPFGESKNVHKTFVRCVFAIFATIASFLRVIAKLQ